MYKYGFNQTIITVPWSDGEPRKLSITLYNVNGRKSKIKILIWW